MKVICLILSVFVMLLSTVPCCDDDNCNDEIKTEQTSDSNNNHDDTGHCSSTCSPFLTCGSCSGFVISFFGVELQPSEILIEKNNKPFKQGWITSFYADFWQPPKMS